MIFICVYIVDYPFGQVPVLEMNGKQIGQSVAICRYLGTNLKLAGKNAWESMEIDSIVDTIVDLRMSISIIISGKYYCLISYLLYAEIVMAAFYETDEKVKAEKMKTLCDETIPCYLGKLEKIAKENNGHLALGKVSVFYVHLRQISLLTILSVNVG